MLTVGSLFAGIGGIDLGLERAGMQTKWQVEIDPFCLKVLDKHWPKVDKYEDIREVGSHNLAPVDLICGGFPCQPHSLAGKREASGDERDLWGEMFRVICEVKPRWVLAENVPGLLSSEVGRFFGRVLRDLASVGYDVEWESLPAAAFGAPHIRERVFIVANTGGLRCYTGRAKQSLQGVGTYGKAREDVANAKCREDHGIGGNSKCGSNAMGRKEQATFCDDGQTDYNGLDGCSEDVANDDSVRVERTRSEQQATGLDECDRMYWWSIEPDVGRVANGVPSRVDRLRSLGNAVVPQAAEWIGRRIIESNSNKEQK